MSDKQQPKEENPSGDTSPPDSQPRSQEIKHSQVSAIVPEKVARGTFSTGAVVVQGAHEFIIDFLLRMTSPQQLAARVVVPPQVVGRLIAALEVNLRNYERQFGAPHSPAPQPTETPQPTPQELYEQLKLSDDVLSGSYANAGQVQDQTPRSFRHTAARFEHRVLKPVEVPAVASNLLNFRAKHRREIKRQQRE